MSVYSERYFVCGFGSLLEGYLSNLRIRFTVGSCMRSFIFGTVDIKGEGCWRKEVQASSHLSAGTTTPRLFFLANLCSSFLFKQPCNGDTSITSRFKVCPNEK